MSTLGLTLTLFMTLIFTSCQVKESSGGGLFSGHAPTTNKFTVQTPTSKIYLETEVITVNVSFPFDIVVTGGSPRLRMTIGATTRYGTYTPGSDPKVLTFNYTVVASDNDTNGIDVNALELNGSTLQFDNDGVMENCDVATVTLKNFPNAKVDTTAPTVSSLTFVNPVGQYNAGKTLSMRVTYSENVIVTGSPYFQVTFGAGGTHNLAYQSGSGSNVLTFSYVIGQSDYDINGYVFSNTIVLNGGTIKDTATINASLNLASVVAAANTASANIDIVGTYPYVVNVDVPVNGTYTASEELDFVLEFDRNVDVTGTPFILLTVGTAPTTSTREAQYVSGSGSNLLTFRYTTVPGDVDADGIAAATTITQNAGTITASTGGTSYFLAGNNLFVMPVTTGIRINAIQPQAITVTRNTDITNAVWGTAVDNVWNIGQNLNITVGFNTGILIGQTGGTPYIPITIGATARNATYLSGGDGQTSLVFRYTIQEGDLDTDGTIAIGSIVLNGGTMTDAALTNASLTLPVAGLATTQVDGIRPTITTVAAPANNTFSTATGNNHLNMNFTVTWSEAVNYSTAVPAIPMDVGGTATPLAYASGSNTAAIIHRPAALTGRTDTDGVTLSSPLNPGAASIRDQAGNTAAVFTFTPPTTTGILVDTTAPTVVSVTPITANGTYALGDNLDFDVTFSESVTTLVAGGYPRIPVTIGSTTRYLVPTANATGTSHTFRYTIVNNESDTDGIVLGNAVTHNGTTAYARDIAWNNSAGTFTLPNTSGILVDSTAPTVASVSRTANGTYETGDDISITITYSENVTVDTAGGTPRIAVGVGSNTRYMDYASGSGTTALVFTYTLASDDFDADGLPTSINTLSLNGGTITDGGNNSVPTTFTAQNLSSIYAMFTNTRMWVQSSFASRAKSGSPTVSNSGAVTTEACGTGTCRTFNGDDALNLTSALNNVETIFIVFKIPAALNGNHDIFGSDIQLIDDGADYDLDTVNAVLSLDGNPYSGTNHDANMATGSTHVLQVDFSVAQSYSAQTLIGNTFNGAIGEVIAISGTLTIPQKTAIRSYLSTKY